MALTTLLSLAGVGSAHSTHEAQELEVHILSDEGTDIADSYGGYDINDVFLGAASRADLGQGALGDGIYLRIEAYGHPAQTTTQAPWSLRVQFKSTNGTVTRSLQTLDGEKFTHDFDDLTLAVDGRELHIERAFLLNSKTGLKPGDVVQDVVVTTRYGADLRDIAPGGLYVPGTNGALTYMDPTAIAGKGRLVDAPAASPPSNYFAAVHLAAQGHTYTVNATSNLRRGSQHMILEPPTDAATKGWTFTNASGGGPVAGNASAAFKFDATPGAGAQPMTFALRTDVGGRLQASLAPDGTLTVGAATVRPQPTPVRSSPAPFALLALGLLATALARRPA